MKILMAVFIAMMTWVPTCDSDGGSPTGPGTTFDDGGTYIPSGPNFNGWVIDAVKHAYVAGATVCFEATSICTKSKSNGIYRLWPVDTGTFTIVTTHPDFKPDTTISRVGPDSSTRLNIYLQPVGE